MKAQTKARSADGIKTVLDYLGQPFSLRDDKPWSHFFGGPTWSGKSVSHRSLLQLSAANACIRLIAETVATLPIKVYEKGDNGERKELGEHPIGLLLADSPNAEQTPVEYLEGMIGSLLLQGDAFSAKERGFQGRVTSLRFWNPASVSVRRERSTGEIVYRYRDPDNGEVEELPPEEVFHVKGFGFGGIRGETPIGMQRQTMANALAAEETAGRMLGQGLQAPGFLKYKGGTLKPDQRTSIQDIIAKFSGSQNAGKMMVLEADLDWQAIGMKAEDYQLLQTRRHSIEDICRWYRVPPVLIGHTSEGQTMFGSGVEQLMIWWLTTGLRTVLKRVESAIAKRLITSAERRRGVYAEFNVEGLLRGDMAAQAEWFSKMTQNGLMSRAEGRRKLNLPYVEGSEILTVQVNLVDLAKLGQSDPSGVVKNALISLLTSGGTDENQRPSLPALR